MVRVLCNPGLGKLHGFLVLAPVIVAVGQVFGTREGCGVFFIVQFKQLEACGFLWSPVVSGADGMAASSGSRFVRRLSIESAVIRRNDPSWSFFMGSRQSRSLGEAGRRGDKSPRRSQVPGVAAIPKNEKGPCERLLAGPLEGTSPKAQTCRASPSPPLAFLTALASLLPTRLRRPLASRRPERFSRNRKTGLAIMTVE